MTQEAFEYRKKVKLRHRVLFKRISDRHITIGMYAYFENPENLSIGRTELYLGDGTSQECHLNQSPKKVSRLGKLGEIKVFRFDTKGFLQDDARIVGRVYFKVIIEGEEVVYRVIEKKHYSNVKFKYLPQKAKYVNDYSVFFRLTSKSTLMITKREMEDIEHTAYFRFIESRPVSLCLYLTGKIRKVMRRNKLNLYFEKFCSKAEEGTFELFQLAQKSENSKNYYLIDENGADYEKIKDADNVIKKHSLRYYWSIYAADAFISTEIPDGHINVFRANNRLLKKAIFESKFVFLQHGVTYLKRQGKSSSFLKNKNGEPDLMVVGSAKEQRVCADMLRIEEDKILITGLPIYALTEYKHIDSNSEDYVMVMLTWKPYEEHLKDFTETSYYTYSTEIVKMLEKYINKDRIILVGHPKVNDLLEEANMQTEVWDKSIAEAISQAKLLITDYSSVCYNVFYQGGGVLFFQPDLEEFEEEVGELIPADDEYIGHRVFDISTLEDRIRRTIKDGRIDLEEVRNEEFEKRYLTINEFNDGKNIERIYEALCKRSIL